MGLVVDQGRRWRTAALAPIASGMGRLARPVLVLAMAALATACASAPGGAPRPRPFPTPDRPAPAAPPGPSVVDADTVVRSALALTGVPYRNGGSGPNGFDCSGLVQYVFAQAGLMVPREVRDQWRLGRAVEPDTIAAGDLVFFVTSGNGASHVGIAIGGGQFVHAPSSTGVVRVERFTLPYWARRYLGARRVTR